MCTATTYATKDHYFGRNLDYEYSFHEEITITPRNFPVSFRHKPPMEHHYSMIGMAYVVDDHPLYYEATNEFGLSIAGLNFPGNASYKPGNPELDNITPFEFIPWILGQCRDIEEAKTLISRMNMLNENFSEDLPLQSLHWLISDLNGSVVVESVSEGIKVYDNPTGTMTNNPTFDHQLYRLNDYRNITAGVRDSSFAPDFPLEQYSRGMGSMGLPGDLSSASRFVKAVFTKMNSVSGDSEMESVSQFFHILASVEQQRGCCALAENTYEITIYSSCCNMEKGIYYYRTYDNSCISAVDMRKEDLDSKELIRYPMLTQPFINYQN